MFIEYLGPQAFGALIINEPFFFCGGDAEQRFSTQRIFFLNSKGNCPTFFEAISGLRIYALDPLSCKSRKIAFFGKVKVGDY